MQWGRREGRTTMREMRERLAPFLLVTRLCRNCEMGRQGVRVRMVVLVRLQHKESLPRPPTKS
jgi:hypothetical protein